jgi:hypothetical protein
MMEIIEAGHLLVALFGGYITTDEVVEDFRDEDYMKLSNPTLWRKDPLFASPLPEDIAAAAGFWLLENSTDFSAASAVAAVFFEFQWPSHHHSTTALIRLRDTYTECLRAPVFDRSVRLQALQSAAAYYLLYHTWLIWDASPLWGVEVEKFPPGSLLPSDFSSTNTARNGMDTTCSNTFSVSRTV